ncbi:putative signal transducing protein [Salinimicrobium sp. WS361]|uniref:putative signal transducing protein n=1 Tax=Salinimicrobium sp. WS361 TaxID=3425123 RepID=UPI003D6E4885
MREEFSNVAVFQYSAEAQILKGRLEAEGVRTFMVDNHTIDTDPLVSNAIGGVKLKVRKEDEEKALQVLAAVTKYSVDDEGEEITCPSCKSPKVEIFTSVKSAKSLFFFCLSFLINALPLYIKRNYHCTNCKHEFKLR